MKTRNLKCESIKPSKATDKAYRSWIGELKKRYRATQIKAAVSVNTALIEYYWNLGKDINDMFAEEARYGSGFFNRVSRDMKEEFPNDSGFSPRNIRYCRDFYCLYARSEILQQTVAKSNRCKGCATLQQLVAKLVMMPWGHHCQLIDKCKGDGEKALFYVQRTVQNGWSRNVLLNWLSTDLYEREGKAQTNFALTMPSEDCDLARQLVKDPQVFEVFGLKDEYQEKDLKAAIVANIERTLLSLGKGVAFLGREYPIEIGGETKAIDLLFYIVPLHRYLVMEVKTGKYDPADLGQLSGYIVMAEQCLNTPGDNPPIGVLICKEHNRVLAKFHLEKLALPMGISDYEIKKVLPTSAQLAKCYADAEAQVAAKKSAPSKKSRGKDNA